MNKKLRTDFQYLIKKLENKSFNEEDIKHLYINLRPFFKNDITIREIADFFAHREDRDKGISHQAIDVNYFKVNSISNKTKVNIVKIDNIIFDIILRSIKDYNKPGFENSKAIKLFKKSYDKKYSYFTLNDYSKTNQLVNILNEVFSKIEVREILNEKKIIDSLKSSLRIVNKILKLEININDLINNCKDDIIICLLSLLNFSSFKLYDGKKGNLILTLVDNLKGGYRFRLMSFVPLQNDSTVVFPFLSTAINPIKYLEKNMPAFIEDFSDYKLIRNSNKELKLINFK